MSIRLIGAIAAAALIVAAVVWTPVFAGQKSSKPKLQFTSVLGPDTPVPPNDFAVARAQCPRGYIATGGGLFLGAIIPITDGPTVDGRAWESDGFNPSGTNVFDHSVLVQCAKGKKGLKVTAASVSRDVRMERREEFLNTREKGR